MLYFINILFILISLKMVRTALTLKNQDDDWKKKKVWQILFAQLRFKGCKPTFSCQQYSENSSTLH